MPSIPATDFPRFLELPFEIRWAIYKLCLPTRVVDSAITPARIMRIMSGSHRFINELAPAYRYMVTGFSKMPVICKAIPEVHHETRRHLVAPLANEWAWGWLDQLDQPSFTDPRPILFDPRSDVLYISPGTWGVIDEYPHLMDRTTLWLARSQGAVVAIDDWSI